MPALIGALAGAAAGEAIGGLLFAQGGIFTQTLGSLTFGQIIGKGVGALVSGVITTALTPREGGQMEQLSRGILVNTTSTIAPIQVVYGFRRVGGSRILLATSGESNGYLHIVIVWGEGEIDQVGSVYVDGVIDSDARFASVLLRSDHVGTDTQAADATLVAQLPGVWTTDCTVSGCAYTYLRAAWDQTAFPYGLPNVTADVYGLKVYDPRLLTTAWSQNPALCIRDFLTNTRYGRGIPTSYIDEVSFADVADYCDELVTIPTATGTSTQARYTLDGVVSVDDNPLDILRQMLTSCRGFLYFSGGKYKLGCERLQAASGFTFTEDNIVGAWTIAGNSKRTRFNRVKAKFFNPDAAWQPDIAIQDSTAFRTQDNGQLLELAIDLPYTANAYTAAYIAQQTLKQSRFGIVVQFTATIAALAVEIGDVVAVTHTSPGWSGKLFRVLNLELQPNDEVRVTLREYDDSVFTIDLVPFINPGPSTSLPDPRTVAEPVNVALSSGTAQLVLAGDGTVVSRIRVDWTTPADVFVTGGGSIEVEHALTGTDAWIRQRLPGAAAFAYISPVDDGQAYDVRVRSVNTLGVASAWVQPAAHTVVGKTEPPSDVTTFLIDGDNLTWSAVADLDLAGYRLRFQQGINRSWGDAVPMHTGLVTDSPFVMRVKPAGQATLMIKAVDTSGNESADPAVIVTDLGDPVLRNVFVEFDRKASAWPGTLTGGTVSGGNLVADSTTLMWNADDSVAMWNDDGSTLMWTSSTTYKQLVYTDRITVSRALTGSRLVIEAAIAGDAWQIEYRENSPAPMWGDPAGTMWGADSAALMWDTHDWQPWPGSITVQASMYDFRVTVAQGSTQGVVSAFNLIVDVPDVSESLADVAISAAGTRLAITEAYESIRVVSLTLQADGGSAITVKVEDKDAALGPLVKAYNSAGTAVDGTVDALVQGY